MADPGRVAIAGQVLAELGVTVADLQPDEAPRVPMIDEYPGQLLLHLLRGGLGRQP